MAINANRFIAPVINPKVLPAPDAIETLSAEAILADRMAGFQKRADEAGFAYDVGALETDPIKIDQEVHAFRETLMRARVNSGIRAVLPAYAQGSDLDAIAARANVTRLVLTEATDDEQAVMESDASLLLRYLTSFAVPSAGSPDGYIWHAVMAYPEARDIAVAGPEVHSVPGRAAIYLLAEDGAAVPSGRIDAVRDRLTQSNVKPLTDQVTVAAAEVIPYAIAITITVPPGPAPETVRLAAIASIRKAADARFAIGAKVWVNALEGAAYVANVLRVQRSAPSQDIDPGPIGAAFCNSITVEVVVQP